MLHSVGKPISLYWVFFPFYLFLLILSSSGDLGCGAWHRGAPKGTWPRMCYTYDAERMEQHEGFSEGVSAQAIAALPTEIDYSRM